jgi:hypothetical protein
MDENINEELRTALNYLKAGRIKDARPIILQILKTNPEIDQAWYMLSFVVSDRQKQIYALQQVINLNPDHDKAKARLSKVLKGGASVSPTKSQSEQPSEFGIEEGKSLGGSTDQEKVIEQHPGPVDNKEEASTGSGEKPAKKAKKPKKPKKLKKPKKPKKTKKQKEEVFSLVEGPDDNGTITANTFGDYTGQKRNWLRSLRVVVSLLIIIAGCYFIFTVGGPVLSGFLDSLQPQPGAVEETDTPEASATPTDAGGGRKLPPTWTPSPLPSETPTLEPSQTPTPTEIPTS